MLEAWLVVHSPATDAPAVIAKRRAAAQLAAVAAGLPHIVFPLAPASVDIELARGPVRRRHRGSLAMVRK